MPVTNSARLSSFDADAVCRAVQSSLQVPLYSFCEFTVEGFHPLYVDDRTIAMYDDVDQMSSHFQRIHTHVHMDFMEVNLLTEQLFPDAERVDYLTTTLDRLKLLRVYVGDDGLFLALEPGEPVEPVVETIKHAALQPAFEPADLQTDTRSDVVE